MRSLRCISRQECTRNWSSGTRAYASDLVAVEADEVLLHHVATTSSRRNGRARYKRAAITSSRRNSGVAEAQIPQSAGGFLLCPTREDLRQSLSRS